MILDRGERDIIPSDFRHVEWWTVFAVFESNKMQWAGILISLRAWQIYASHFERSIRNV